MIICVPVLIVNNHECGVRCRINNVSNTLFIWRYTQLLVILFYKSSWTWDTCFAFASSAVCVVNVWLTMRNRNMFPSLREVQQYNHIFDYKMFRQKTSVKTIKTTHFLVISTRKKFICNSWLGTKLKPRHIRVLFEIQWRRRLFHQRSKKCFF